MNVLGQVNNSPVGHSQVRPVALSRLISLIGGFGLLVTSSVGPAITREWSLSPSSAGELLSGGLAGLAIGALATIFLSRPGHASRNSLARSEIVESGVAAA